MAAALKARTREDYPYLLDYRTRWSDNDMYAHMNNTVYNVLFDSAINTYLIDRCGFDPATRAPQHALAVHTHTDFFASLAFPQVAEVGLRILHLGRTSARWEAALFVRGDPAVRAVGVFVQVFVDPSGRPNPDLGIHPALRAGLERLLVSAPGGESKL